MREQTAYLWLYLVLARDPECPIAAVQASQNGMLGPLSIPMNGRIHFKRLGVQCAVGDMHDELEPESHYPGSYSMSRTARAGTE